MSINLEDDDSLLSVDIVEENKAIIIIQMHPLLPFDGEDT